MEQGPPWETDNHSLVQSNPCLLGNNTHCRTHNSPPPKLSRVTHIPTKPRHPTYVTSIFTLSYRLCISTYRLYVNYDFLRISQPRATRATCPVYVNDHKFKMSLTCTTPKLRVVVEVILVISCRDKSQHLRTQNNDAINMDLRNEVRG